VVEKAARANPDAKGILLVHLETSTSILNPVEEIGRVAHKYGMLLMVDAVASLGGTPFNMDRWNVDMCASASQKCLATPPGLSPIAVNETAWKKIYGNSLKTRDRGFYLNLRVWKKFAVEWADWHPFPVTMATSLVLGLKASLETLLEEGVDNRSRRLAKLGMRLRAGMREIGFEPYTPDEIMAPMLTAAYGPKGVPTSHIVKFVADQYDIRIAGGLGDALVDKVIRIGHMSPVITDKHVDMTLAALEAFHE
jgi:alanine-glyoxylate transaminase/serine-glyoxylate transaminase/serine-pyruvate transaminase